jgi:molecular chaperone GrpE
MKKTNIPKPEPAANDPVPSNVSAGAPELAPADGTPPPPSSEPLGPKEIEELKSLAAKANEHWEQLLRTAADFENFRKRAARERQEAAKYACEPLLLKLIPVLDNFDMALAATNTAVDPNAQSFQAGITMIHQQLKNLLTESGMEEIDALHKPFDPHWHEAISQQETAEAPEGQVVQQLRKGYRLRDRLLRPATVIVAKPPTEKAQTELA